MRERELVILRTGRFARRCRGRLRGFLELEAGDIVLFQIERELVGGFLDDGFLLDSPQSAGARLFGFKSEVAAIGRGELGIGLVEIGAQVGFCRRRLFEDVLVDVGHLKRGSGGLFHRKIGGRCFVDNTLLGTRRLRLEPSDLLVSRACDILFAAKVESLVAEVEKVLRVAGLAFGHRLGGIVGGVEVKGLEVKCRCSRLFAAGCVLAGLFTRWWLAEG